MSTTPTNDSRDDTWEDEDQEWESEVERPRKHVAAGALIAAVALSITLVATVGVALAVTSDSGPNPACKQAMLEAGYTHHVVAEAGAPSNGTCGVVDMCEAALLGEYNPATAIEVSRVMADKDPDHVVKACSAPLRAG
jgi:hypothetical protein